MYFIYILFMLVVLFIYILYLYFFLKSGQYEQFSSTLHAFLSESVA
jgi:nitrogen fixation-related uncharacterized protein